MPERKLNPESVPAVDAEIAFIRDTTDANVEQIRTVLDRGVSPEYVIATSVPFVQQAIQHAATHHNYRLQDLTSWITYLLVRVAVMEKAREERNQSDNG